MKQRIVGALVLISLAAIFLPMFLGGRDDPTEREIEIPPRPKQLSAPVTTTDDESLHVIEDHGAEIKRTVIESASEAQAPVTAESPPVPEEALPETKPEPLTPDAQALADSGPESKDAVPAWAVQVGSFSSSKNALALRDRLRGLKFTAYVEELQQGKVKVFRVRVGPVLKAEQAEALKAQLKKQAQLDGVVMRHR